ncbi:acetyl-CoA carboxylase [Sarcoptes scabiei]|nr:acetyl-CoA carboxylase [Sarcoptes scabiei]
MRLITEMIDILFNHSWAFSSKSVSSFILVLSLLFGSQTLIRADILTREIGSPEDDGLMAYKDCGMGNLRRLKVVGCDPIEERRSRFCLLTRGSNASLVAKFIADDNYATAVTDVRIKIGFLEFGYPPIEHDACRNYVSCPLHKHAVTVARVTFPIPSLSPRFANMLITARLYGPRGELIVCGQAKAGLL